MGSAMRRLRIAQVAPPVERVPPAAYGGTERVVDELNRQLAARGHELTVFASGDSDVPGRLVPTVERALRPAGIESDASGWFATTVKMVVEQAAEFDIIHSHLEWWSIPLARLSPVPTVATFHGRLDLPWADRLFNDAPEGMVAISRHQASVHPDVPWTIIHNGLTLDTAPFLDEPGDAFCFVGRVDAEKGIIEAIDIALRAGRRLRIAAKVGNLARQRDYYEAVFRPALQRAGRSVEYLGELQPAERDQLFAESYATLMPGAWPEPFGLVSIESLACGTPVLARRVGALPEIIREGVDGFFGDDAVAMAFFADRLGGLDRREIRERVIERFSAARMADRYEELYARMIAGAKGDGAVRERVPDAAEVEEALAVQLPVQVTEPADAELPEKREGSDAPEPDEAPLAELSADRESEAAGAEEPETAVELAAVSEAGNEPEAEVELEGAAEAEPAEPVAVNSPEAAAETAAFGEEITEAPTEPAHAKAEVPPEWLEDPEPWELEAIGAPAPAARSERVSAPAAVTDPEPERTDEPAAEAPEPESKLTEEPVAESQEPVSERADEPVAEAPEPESNLVEPVAAIADREPEPAEEVVAATPEPGSPPEEPAAATAEPLADPGMVDEPIAATAEPEPEMAEAPVAAHARAEEAERPDESARAEEAERPDESARAEEAQRAEETAAAVADLEAIEIPVPVQAAVVDVVVADADQPASGGDGEAALEGSGVAVDGAVAEPEAESPQAEQPIAASVAATPDETSTSARRDPVAVGPGPSPQDLKPVTPAPPAEPAPITRLGPAKQVPKRPSRTISIFTRSWSGSSKKAASARQRDRS
jgi:glycosyltransferase involved in cell wall biosynthesis